MIQRVQSLYLLAAAIAVGLVFVLDLYVIKSGQFGEYTVNIFNHYFESGGLIISKTSEWQNTLGVTLAVLSIVLSLGTIFLHGNRPLQARLAKLGGVLNLALLVVMVYIVDADFVSGLGSEAEFETNGYNYITFILPVFAGISSYIAFRKILKDEALVRASDRLR